MQVARALDRPVERTAHAYFSLGLELGLDRLKAGLRRIETRDYWERRALQAVVEELYAAQRTLTRQALLAAPGATPDAAVQDWLSGEQADVGRVRRAFADLEASGPLTLPKLTLAGRLLHGLTQD